MNSEQYIENILQATSILTQQAIKNANFDKTIQAVIIQCTDPTIGKYKVQYQDGYWYAYSGSTQVSYSSGSSVYILVPNGDMSKDKTILGTTKPCNRAPPSASTLPTHWASPLRKPTGQHGLPTSTTCKASG